jgi:hypothetical protein
VGFKIGLDGYNDFFEQDSGFYLCLLQGKVLGLKFFPFPNLAYLSAKN